MRSATRWAVAESGTRYVKVKTPPKPKRENPDVVSIHLRDWMLADGNQGDLELAVLLAVRNLIRTEASYIGKARATNSSGMLTEPTSADARRWNIAGALLYVTHTFMTQAQRRVILDMMKQCLPAEHRQTLPLFKWEEQARHSQVVHLLNMTIALRKRALGYL